MSEQQAMLKEVGKALEVAIRDLYGRQWGFALLVFEFDTEDGRCDYISNADRENMMLTLRECANSMERGTLT